MDELLKIEQGTTWNLQVTLKNDDGSAIDLSGASAHMQLRAFAASPDVLLDLSSPSSGISLGGADGVITINATAAQTSALRAYNGVYDLKVTYTDGTVRNVLAGRFVLTPAVTR